MGLNTCVSKRDQILWILSLHPKEDEALRDVHIKEAETLRDASLFFGEPKTSQIEEHEEGLSWRQLLGKHRWSTTSNGEIIHGEWCFPRQTLDRHLKKLVKDGVVEKVQEPRERRKRGRPSWQYRIKHWYSWGCMHVRLPTSRPAGPDDPRWFLGTKIERLGKKGVRMWPKEKKQFDELFKEDASFKAAVQSARRKRRRDIWKERSLKGA